jgi:hypothetical protein
VLDRELERAVFCFFLRFPSFPSAFAGRFPQLTGRRPAIATLSTTLASEVTRVAITRDKRVTKESVMFTVTQFSRSTQRIVCLALAAMIVTVSLSIGALGAKAALHTGYSVTITQIQ